MSRKFSDKNFSEQSPWMSADEREIEQPVVNTAPQPIPDKSEKPPSWQADVSNQFYNRLPFIKKMNARKVLSLDIDVDKIRYLVGKKSGKFFQAQKWGIQKFPAEEANRLKAMQIALENIRAKIYKADMLVEASIYSPDINIRQIVLPKMRKKSDLGKAILFKNQQDLQSFDEKSHSSYEIIEEFEEDQTAKLRLLVVVASSETITKYLTIFHNAKLVLSKLIPRPAALQAAYLQMVQQPQRDLIINISYDFTQICYLKSGQLEYFRNLGIGARNLEVIIHDGKHDVKPEAEMKMPGVDSIKPGSDGSNILRQRLLAKVKDLQQKQNPVLHTFFSEILRFLAYVQGKDKKDFVDRIYISGYGVRKESLLPYLRGRLNMPILIMAPQLTEEASYMAEYGEHFTTIGAILQEKEIYNLLPLNFRHSILFKKLNTALFLLILICFCGAGYFSYLQFKIEKEKQFLLKQLQNEYERLNPVESKYRNLMDLIEKVMIENKELQSYIKASSPLIEVLRLLSNETPPEVRLESINFQSAEQLRSDKSKKQSIPPQNQLRIDVSGVISSELIVGDVILINFITHINDLRYFEKIELVFKNKIADKDLLVFSIRLTLNGS